MIDGEPMIKLSWHEGILHRALRGGWHYRKTIAGKILKDKPEKDIHSHPGDSLWSENRLRTATIDRKSRERIRCQLCLK